MTPVEIELRDKPELLRAYCRNVTVSAAIQAWVYSGVPKDEAYEQALVLLANENERQMNELCRAVRMGYVLLGPDPTSP